MMSERFSKVSDPIKVLATKEMNLFCNCYPEFIAEKLIREYLIIMDFISIYGQYKPKLNKGYIDLFAKKQIIIDQMIESIKKKDQTKCNEVQTELKKLSDIYTATITPKYE